MTCDELRSLSAELAAGTLVGEERAAALDHLAGCPGCREEVASLAEVLDELLLIAPAVEPPLGFESRVLGALHPVVRRRRRWPVVLAAAVVALVLGVGAVLASRPGPSSPPQVAALHAADGRDVGRAVLAGHWVVVDVVGLRDTAYDIEVERAGGRVDHAGKVRLAAGKGSASVKVSGTVVSVHVVSEKGDYECEAEFSSH